MDLTEKITSVPASIQIIKEGYKIKSKGVFNIEDLYLELYLWFQHHGYAVKELEYRIVYRPDGVKHTEVLWQNTRVVDEYTSFTITLNLSTDLSEAEVTLEGGKKVTRQKGTLEFRSGARIDRKVDVWEGKVLGNVQAKVYELLIRDRLRAQKVELYTEAHKLYDELKAFMMLYR